MDKAIRSVLVVGAEPYLHDRLGPLLKRRHFDVDRVAEPAAALALIEAVALDVLVLQGSISNPDLGEVLATIRRPGSPCRRSAVLVLTAPGAPSPAGAVTIGGNEFTRFLPMNASEEELNDTIAALLRESPRLSVRINIRIETQLGNGPTMVLTQTENVSLGGMLVRMTRPQPVDATLKFELLLPTGYPTLSGSGQVVRHTQNRQGQTSGVGMKFINFNAGGREVLKGFLEHTNP